MRTKDSLSPIKKRVPPPTAITQIRTIRVFQNPGLSLDEIRTYFNKSADLKPMINRLEKMRDELNLTIEKLKERTNTHGNILSQFSR